MSLTVHGQCDQVVDGGDLTLLLGAWGDLDMEHDLNGDGYIDAADLTIILAEWGACPLP